MPVGKKPEPLETMRTVFIPLSALAEALADVLEKKGIISLTEILQALDRVKERSNPQGKKAAEEAKAQLSRVLRK